MLTQKVPPFGINGGEPGQCGREWLETATGKVIKLKVMIVAV